MDLQGINWEVSAAGTWPRVIKINLMVLCCAVVIVAWYYFDTLDQWQSYKKIEKKELTLKKKFRAKQEKAVNLVAYRRRFEQIEYSLDEALLQLPALQEVASLLVDISKTGLASGLEFQLFKPTSIVHRDFYDELPIAIKMTGSYKEFALFISKLAALPRIVTVHDIGMSSAKDNTKDMQISLLLKTYSGIDKLE